MHRLVLLALASTLLGGCGDGIPRAADGTPHLVQAAERGDLTDVRQLLADGSPVNVRDVCLRTPLMLAAQQGRLEAVRELLGSGALPNLHEKGNYTALMLAASNNHQQVVRLLAEQGAAVDDQERTRGWTALIWAAKRGHAETVETLLALSADPEILDNEQHSALWWARDQGHSGVAAMLEQAAGLREINAP